MKHHEEVWRSIEGYEGRYEVSDQGRVRGVDRYVAVRGGGQRLFRGKILRAQDHGEGYKTVTLNYGGGYRRHTVHRLVAKAFVEGEGEHVRHLNHNRTDNRAENLAWGSVRENIHDTIRDDRHQHGESHWTARLTEDDVRQIKTADPDLTLIEVAEDFGISKSAVSAIQRGKRWKHVEPVELKGAA